MWLVVLAVAQAISLAVAQAISPVRPFNRCAPRYVAAAAHLAAADQAGRRRARSAEIAALDAGLETLGYGYAPPNTAEETDTFLLFAAVEQRGGKLGKVAYWKRKALSARLGMCTRDPMPPPS